MDERQDLGLAFFFFNHSFTTLTEPRQQLTNHTGSHIYSLQPYTQGETKIT